VLDLHCQPHRRAVLADAGQDQKLFVHLQLRARPDPTVPGTKRAGTVAWIVAVDTSGSMFAKLPGGTSKIERAIEAISSFGDLSPDGTQSQLAIVQFDTEATILLPLATLGTGSARSRIAVEAGRLRNFGGGTMLSRALEETFDTVPDHVVRKAVILTDGETHDEPDCRRLVKRLAERDIGVIGVGLGTDYNEDFLAELVDATNGFLYHLSEAESSLARLRNTLREELRRSQRELITGLRLALHTAPGIQLAGMTRVVPMVQILAQQRDGTYHIGNVDVDGEVDLIAELDLPDREPGPIIVGEVAVSYDVPAAQLTAQSVAQRLDITYTTDRRLAGELDQQVVFFVRQARVSQLADQVVSQARSGDIAEARKSVQLMHHITQQIGNPAVLRAAELAVSELSLGDTLQPDTAKSIKVGAKTLTISAPPTKPQ
jgi:Ca-activated chloride channel family protein